MKDQMIADLLGHPGPFYRSVSLKRDQRDPTAGRGFVLTPWLERGLREILGGFQASATRRAWRIVGDFGVGKSALALSIVQALDPRVCDPKMPVRQIVDAMGGAPRMYPLVIAGSRAGLSAALSETIGRTVATEDGLIGKTARKIISQISDPFEALIPLRDALCASEQYDGLSGRH